MYYLQDILGFSIDVDGRCRLLCGLYLCIKPDPTFLMPTKPVCTRALFVQRMDQQIHWVFTLGQAHPLPCFEWEQMTSSRLPG